jgi:hypothetical protein
VAICNNDQLNSDITAEEMMKAVKHLKNKKASGLDCIFNDFDL